MTSCWLISRSWGEPLLAGAWYSPASHSPGPGCLPACWPAWPQWASRLGAQYSAVSPPSGQVGSRLVHTIPTSAPFSRDGSLSGASVLSFLPWFSPFNTALLDSEAMGVLSCLAASSPQYLFVYGSCSRVRLCWKPHPFQGLSHISVRKT